MSLGCHGGSTALLLEPLDLPSLSCPLGSDTFLRDARRCPGPLSCSNSGDTPDPVHPSLPLLSPISCCRTSFFNPASNQSRVPGRKSLHLAFLWPLLSSHSSVSGTASPHPPHPPSLQMCRLSHPGSYTSVNSACLLCSSRSLACASCSAHFAVSPCSVPVSQCSAFRCLLSSPFHFTLCCWVV